MIYIKIFNSNPKVVSICDADLINKKFENEKMQIEINESFFKGELYDIKNAKKFIKNIMNDYVTFNIVGKKSIKIAKELNLINNKNIVYIKDIPIALVL
ncbi:MAG: DUF424 family protein [Candidatus Pacearchaeota archaeon]